MGSWSDRILTVLIVFLVAAVAILFCAPHIGVRVDAVLSGSMEPALSTGGVIISRPVRETEIHVGDIVTFASPQGEGFISHRVIAVESGPPNRFQTKGDANEDADPITVGGAAIAGKVVLHIPFLGYLSMFVKTLPGFVLTILLPGLLIICLEIRGLYRDRRSGTAGRGLR